jgi:late competence protein required for DNA uptake (superfamily II DNA/RNA helicase)
MGRTNTDKYTIWDGYFYRKSTTKDISKGSYLCNRWCNNQGKWGAKHSKEFMRCRGHLMVKKGVENKDDKVYLFKAHDCDTAKKPLSFGYRLIIGQMGSGL